MYKSIKIKIINEKSILLENIKLNSLNGYCGPKNFGLHISLLINFLSQLLRAYILNPSLHSNSIRQKNFMPPQVLLF